LPSDSAREHFSRHLRKYVDIYSPDCPWETSTTNRYTVDTHEAATFARHPIKKGELIKYLSGIQAPITKEEEKDLDLTRRDFSIVMSSRKKIPSIFLGPARFANHDCEANARLTTRGFNGMTVVAARDVKRGEEITVTYGNDYFGIDNCECLCGTCERLQRNGWDPEGTAHAREQAEEREDEADSPQSDSSYAFRRERRRATSPLPSSQNITPEPESSPSKKRKYSEVIDSTESTENSPKHPRLQNLKKRPTSRLSQVHLADSNDASAELSEMDDGPSSPVSGSLRLAGPLQSSFQSSAPTSIADSAIAEGPRGPQIALTKDTVIEIPVEALKELTNNSDETVTIAIDVVDHVESIEQADQSQANDAGDKGTSSELSDLEDGLVLDDRRRKIVRKKEYGQPRQTRHALAQITKKEGKAIIALNLDRASSDRSRSVDPTARRPGDYTLTPRLLVKAHSRWVKCHVCSENFVQEDAYQTRFACPRCERHSKLYGYRWPKTDKSGKHDTEERILDHRTIHRFVDNEEEKQIRKGRRSGLQVLIAEAIEETERDSSDLEDSAIEESPPKKRSKKRQHDEEESDMEEQQVIIVQPDEQVRRKRGRPRKDADESASASVEPVPAPVVSAQPVKKEKEKPKVPEGPQAESWHDKHGRFGGRWLYLTEKPKALYDDDRPPSPTTGKRRAAQVAAEKLPELSGRRKSMPAKLPSVQPATSASKSKSSVATASTPTTVSQKKLKATKPKASDSSIRVARHKPVKVEVACEDSESEPEETPRTKRKYVKSGFYTKAAMSSRKAENPKVFELPEGSSAEDEGEEEQSPQTTQKTTRKYNKTGMYTKTAMAQRKLEKLAARRQTLALKQQEPEVVEESEEEQGDSEQEVHIVVRSPVKPGKLKRPTHRRTTMG